MISKQQQLLLLFLTILISTHITAFDQQQCDKLMTYYIKNDDDQFKEFLDECAASAKNNAELYNNLQSLNNKFNDFQDFYCKKRDKRAKRGRKNLVNAFFYSMATALSAIGSGYYIYGQNEEATKVIVGAVVASAAALFAWLGSSHLTSSILEYKFFPKLLRKNNKFRAIVEKLKKATAMQMEVHLPTVDGVKLEVN